METIFEESEDKRDNLDENNNLQAMPSYMSSSIGSIDSKSVDSSRLANLMQSSYKTKLTFTESEFARICVSLLLNVFDVPLQFFLFYIRLIIVRQNQRLLFIRMKCSKVYNCN
jgi:hypothetical protein